MHAFPKSARLRRSEEFRETLDQGVKAVSSQIVMFARPRGPEILKGGDASSRLGLIVSKKVGESVARNRVKRHVREAFRHLAPDLTKAAELAEMHAMDLVVIARANAAAASSADIADALRYCIGRLSRQLSRESAPQGSHA